MILAIVVFALGSSLRKALTDIGAASVKFVLSVLATGILVAIVVASVLNMFMAFRIDMISFIALVMTSVKGSVIFIACFHF